MKPTERERYDIIGDIHGYADPLRALLEKLGYDEEAGHFRHPERKAIFVGDFIDRGPKIREVLLIVRGMVDAGAALAVIGNHELNALRYHSTWSNGKPMRAHSAKNTKQHEATLNQIAEPFPDEWQEWLLWFRSLPLYLDLQALRVVHASWCGRAVSIIDGRRFDDCNFFHEACRASSPENLAVRTLLNGPELLLPDGEAFTDKEGHPHNDIRACWFREFDKARPTYRDMVFPPCEQVPALDIPAHRLANLSVYGASEPPVVFGHYWLFGSPAPLAPNATCVDYSVASKKGGYLTTYRWDGECALDASKFVCVSSEQACG